jgi:16S rRNA (cytosine967-C5)-methyltransferase
MADLGLMSVSRQPPSAPKLSIDAPEDPQDLKARFAALAMLDAALARRNGLDDALSSKVVTDLSPRDRAFARALAMAALRHLGPIDLALQAKVKKAPPDAVIMLLRLGAAQLFHLDTPQFAAVTTTVEMAQARTETRPFKGLVNAVLRGLTREAQPEAEPQAYAPPWLYARWRAAYGGKLADAIARRIPEEPATDLTLRHPQDGAALAEALDGTIIPGGGLRTAKRGDLAEWPGFAEGLWWVQDAAAAIPARLFDLKPGDSALDVCAAPGGKTLQLAATGASVTAVDRSGARLKRLGENLTRMGLAAEIIAADAVAWTDERTFDAVLLDAPCSSTGTFRRHPDVLWAAKPQDIVKLAAVQSQLLDASANRVKPGGRLVYCVCSLEPEEGEAQAGRFLLRRNDFELDPPQPGEGGAPLGALTPSGTLRLLPSAKEPAGGLDGFFIARFRRRL